MDLQDTYLVINILLVSFCVTGNLYILCKSVNRDFYRSLTLGFLLATNFRMIVCSNEFIIVRLSLSLYLLSQPKKDVAELLGQILYYEIPYYCLFIVQISIVFRL